MIIHINTENEAFEGKNYDYELARILRELADKLEEGSYQRSLQDINGNTVGEISY